MGWAIAALVAIAPVSPWAAPAAVESLGARKCSALIEAQKSNATLYAAFGVWIAGYLTAANAYEDDTFDLTPWQPPELAAGQITAACAQQPDEIIAKAAASYVNYLRPNRMKEPSELRRLGANDKAVFMYKSVLAEVRQRLVARGAVIEAPEGEYNNSFGQAILAFQREMDLPQTGLPDTQTLVRLLQN